jgi:hypothetical protein
VIPKDAVKNISRGESELAPPHRRRVVLLGASNVMRGISTIVETAERVWGQPADVLAASGHGRSYGQTSCVLGRSLPGILQCGLWDALARRPTLPTAALVTDIGNDILYGADADQIAAWVAECLTRLRGVCEPIVMTELPLARVALIRPWQYRWIRTLLFPGSRVTFPEAIARAHELNAHVAELARQHRAVLCAPRLDWYGWDPIHIRRACWSRAWSEILSAGSDPATAQRARGSWRRWWQLRCQRPLVRRLFGVEQRRAQPACVLRSGSAISMF